MTIKPFAGIRVVDFTQVIAGPFATYQLAALGADVVKVEQPGVGDQGRRMLAPTPAALDAGMSALFSSVNSGKRSLTLDLKHPDAKKVLLPLLRGADVVVENFKAGTLERLGLAPVEIQALQPAMVICRISGYGQTGPRADAAAYDPVVQAASGMMSVTGYAETGPTKVGFWVVDMTTGMNAAFAIASALFKRTNSGVGEVLDVGMLDTAVSLMSPLASMFLNYGIEPPLTGNGTPGSGGASTVYPTNDGHLTIAAATDAQFGRLMHEIGCPGAADDPRFRTRADRLQNSDAYRELVVAGLAADSTANWQARLAQVGVAANGVQRVADLEADPQVQHRELFSEVGTVNGVDGEFRAVNVGFRLGDERPVAACPPPSVGQHADEILEELGFANDEIVKFRASGVI